MASVAPDNFKFKGLPAPGAFLRLEEHAVQVFKDQERAHLIAALYASKEAFEAEEEPLVKRYLEVSVVAKAPKSGVRSEDKTPEGGLRLELVCPDVVLMWGKSPSDSLLDVSEVKPGDVYALGYKMLHLLPQLEGFKKD